jgi:hypothetical protein
MNSLADPNLDAALLEMAKGNHDAAGLDEHMVSGQPHPARSGSATLSQRVANRWQTAVGLVIGLGLVRGHDNALDWRQQWTTEAWEPVSRFRAHEGRERDRRCAPGVIDRNEVDGVRRAKQSRAVARYAISRTVLG